MLEQDWDQTSRLGNYEHKKPGIHFLYNEDINSPEGVIKPNTKKWLMFTINNK